MKWARHCACIQTSSEQVLDVSANGLELAAAMVASLTRRQKDVFFRIAVPLAHSAKGIAQILNISSRTVEFHKYRIM